MFSIFNDVVFHNRIGVKLDCHQSPYTQILNLSKTFVEIV